MSAKTKLWKLLLCGQSFVLRIIVVVSSVEEGRETVAL